MLPRGLVKLQTIMAKGSLMCIRDRFMVKGTVARDFWGLFRPELLDLEQKMARYWFLNFFKAPSILYPQIKLLKQLIPGNIGYLWNIQYKSTNFPI